MRLDKYLSNATDLSRSEVKRLVRQGRVTVDDVISSSGSQRIKGEEQICIDRLVISMPEHRYFMLHKPAGVVSATKDSNHPTALDLIAEHRHDELQIAGRLDIDTTGLLLITDDGQWNHAVTSPKSDCRKSYLVTLELPLTDNLIEKFSKGIWLNNEKRRCQPAELEILAPRQAKLRISEGKYHQVKRMFAASDNHVTALHREQIGDMVLDEALLPGEYRPLTTKEISSIYSHE